MNLYVKAPNADKYEWIFNGASVGSASTYNIRVAPSTYVWGLPVFGAQQTQHRCESC